MAEPLPADPFDLSGRTALITGSSRGIGRAIAIGLADRGATVIVSGRDAESCATAAAEIDERGRRGRAIPIAASISSPEALAMLVAETERRAGPIDILVCNAASNPFHGPLDEIGDELFAKTIANNIVSTHRLIRLVLPGMKARRSGSVIVTSSIGAFRASPGLGAYCMTKAAVDQLVRGYAVEQGANDIRFNAIAPGFIRTRFAGALQEDPVAQRRIIERTPLGRLGEPDDIAGAAVFLASGASRFVTGQVIVVDGGITLETL